jgi:multisubunit Na+/H+ antiporter MnhF subunit
MLEICIIAVILFIFIILLLLLSNKNIFNKILLLNSLTSLISLLICFLGSFGLNEFYIDIAIIYFLLSFIATLGYLKYFLQAKNKKR